MDARAVAFGLFGGALMCPGFAVAADDEFTYFVGDDGVVSCMFALASDDGATANGYGVSFCVDDLALVHQNLAYQTEYGYARSSIGPAWLEAAATQYQLVSDDSVAQAWAYVSVTSPTSVRLEWDFPEEINIEICTLFCLEDRSRRAGTLGDAGVGDEIFWMVPGETYFCYIRTGTAAVSTGWGRISIAPSCSRADLDANGTLNFDDIDAFITAFLAADLLADIDANGTLNFDDIDAFVASFLAGCP